MRALWTGADKGGVEIAKAPCREMFGKALDARLMGA